MKASRLVARSLRAPSVQRPAIRSSLRSKPTQRSVQPRHVTGTRPFSSTQYAYKGLQPDSSDPKPPSPEPHELQSNKNLQAAELEDGEYNDLAERYLNTLLASLEDMADKDPAKVLEVEYSAGVLSITLPSGTYILNKQPPNKQIWLSSPVTGPKRYDWVLLGTSASQHEKQDAEGATGDIGDDGILGGGKWIYLRDGSSLTETLEAEVGVTLGHEQQEVDPTLKAGTTTSAAASVEG